MTMRKIIFCILLMLPVLVFAQSTENSYSNETGRINELTVETGFGSYYMSSLKDLQNTIISESNSSLPLLKTTSFPSYFNYSIKYGSQNDKGYAGFTCGLMSTGARSSVSDYSGYYLADINCMALHVGYYSRTAIATVPLLKRPLEIGFIVNGSVLYSFVTLRDNLQLYGSDALSDNSNTLNSIGVYTEPMLYVSYMFSRHIGIEFNAGGALSISSPLYYEKPKNEVEIYNKKRFANWSGYRVSIGLITRF